MEVDLKKYRRNEYSQFGEDGILERIFEILPAVEEKWCCEFGAWDGIKYSNTRNLIVNHSWNGILIEGNRKKYKALAKNYRNNENVFPFKHYVTCKGKDSLDNILKNTEIPVEFELLSIDIDGNDYHVWDSLKNYKPKVVIIEFNPSIPSDIEFVQENNPKLNQGNSLLSLVNLAERKGYQLIATTNCNGIFVCEKYFNLFNIQDNHINTLWDTENEIPRLFDLYDGTLVLTKTMKLRWSQINIDTFDLQIIPRSKRRYKYINDEGKQKSGSIKILKSINPFRKLKH